MSEIHIHLISHIILPYCLTKRITFQYIVFLQEITSNKVENKKGKKIFATKQLLMFKNYIICHKINVLSDNFFSLYLLYRVLIS